MTIAEPTTLLTNLLLAAAALALGARLLAPRSSPSRATRLWGGAFLAGALAALAGGIVHGFKPALSPLAHATAWKTVLVASGLAGGLLVAGAGLAALHGTARRALLGASFAAVGVYLALVARSDDIRLAAALGGIAILALFGLGLATVPRDRGTLLPLVAALALSAAGIALQQARVSGPAPFNHNDVCHLLQAAALWPFYRAGRSLRDRESPAP